MWLKSRKLVFSACSTVALLLSCSSGGSGGGGTYRNNDDDDDTTASTGGSSGVVSGTGGSTGPEMDLDDPTGSGGGPAGCAAAEAVSALTPIYMVFMYDTSGSMGNQTFSDGSVLEQYDQRWAPMKAGMTAFFNDPGSSNLFASLDYFPADGGFESTCKVAQYALPSVQLTPLNTPDPLITSLNLKEEPKGGTPTLPALRGAVQYAQQLKQETPKAHVVVVLVTDGEPAVIPSVADGGDGKTPNPACPPDDSLTNTVEGVAAVARAAYTGNPSIPVHVIGVGDSVDSLSAIASAGGTTLTLIGATDPAETTRVLRETLESIQVAQFSCDMPIPPPPDGQNFSPNLVNVQFVHTDGTVEMFGKSIGCTTGVGWEYDSEESPTIITLCPNTCNAIQNDPTGQLKTEFGCETRVL